MMLNNDFFNFDKVSSADMTTSVITVGLSMIASIVLIFVGGSKLIESRRFKQITLQKTLDSSDGYTSNFMLESMLGKQGNAYTVLRPSGKIMIEGIIYDAFSRDVFIDRNEMVEVVGQEGNYLKVKKV
jgi:membrane-bound serine protease (ClpP class)